MGIFDNINRSARMKLFLFLAEAANRLVPYDERVGAGVGDIKLDSKHKFNLAAITHDQESQEAYRAGSREMFDKADAKLHWQMAFIAHNVGKMDTREGIQLAIECCEYWQIARKFNQMRAVNAE